MQPTKRVAKKVSFNGFSAVIFAVILANELVDSFGQYCFKRTALALGSPEIFSLKQALSLASDCLSQGYFWLGLLAVGLVLVCWSAILSRVDLSVATPITSVNYVFVALISMSVLHEQISIKRWIGIVLILIGVALVSASADSRKRSQ